MYRIIHLDEERDGATTRDVVSHAIYKESPKTLERPSLSLIFKEQRL